MPDLADLTTEARNPRTTHIDELSTLEMVTLIHQEDAVVATAIESQLPVIARAIDAIAERISNGGRLFYIGAGTSGRLGVLDASECPPTFSVSSTLIQGLIAGGDNALRISSEQIEDMPEEGKRDLETAGFGATDAVVGIAASGRTPYVIGALIHAQSLGALTISLSCVANSAITRYSEIAITPVTGPEVITGSTRMKAGTAQKMILNMITTGAMTRLGYVYENLMVNVHMQNSKLVERGIRILMGACKIDRQTAVNTIKSAGRSVPVALVMLKAKVDKPEAVRRLAKSDGNVRLAIEDNVLEL